MIEIHGHRGSRGTHPENTLPAFVEARDAGANAVELDVHLSKDGHLVVFHDFDLDGKLLSDLLLSEIQSHWVAPGIKIPTFQDVIEWKLREAPALSLNVEIKRDLLRVKKVPSARRLATATLEQLKKNQLLETSLVQSFDFEIVREARSLEAGLRLSCLFEEEADFASVTRVNGAQIAAIHYPLVTATVAQTCIEGGIGVLPWTVNDEAEWRRLIALGVFGLITDFPRRLARFLDAGK